MLRQVRRWVPQRELIVVADSSFAVLTLLDALRHLPQPVTMITRVRLDAALYEPGSKRPPGQTGRPRLKGKRLPTLQQALHDPTTSWATVTIAKWYHEPERAVEVCSATAVWYHTGMPPVPIRWVLMRDPQNKFRPQALLSTGLALSLTQIVTAFIQRWQMEVTFQEARAHLGIETQRQWNDWALGRTTPALFGLYSLVALMAHDLFQAERHGLRTAAWSVKARPTFSDALAVIRRELWTPGHFSMSAFTEETVNLPRSLFERLTDTVCYAA